MKKIMILILLSILVCGCYRKEKTFKCKSSIEMSKDYYSYIITLKRKEVDISTFKCLDGGYGRDKNSIYVYNYVSSYSGGRKLEEANPETFEVIGLDYGRDKNYAYYHYDRIEDNVDIKTLKFISGKFAKDKNKIYYEGRKIEEADVNTFIVLENSYAKDKNNVYYLGADKNNFYHEKTSNVISGADSKTFKIISGSGNKAEDKNSYYKYGEVVKKK